MRRNSFWHRKRKKDRIPYNDDDDDDDVYVYYALALCPIASYLDYISSLEYNDNWRDMGQIMSLITSLYVQEAAERLLWLL